MSSALKQIFSLLCFCLVAQSCEQQTHPRPLGYMRITMEESSYDLFSRDGFPFSFQNSSLALIESVDEKSDNIKFNIDYPSLRAKVYLSYHKLNGNLGRYLQETRELTYEHIEKASNIEKQPISIEDHDVYGLKYYLSGDVASSTQFYLTDSINHFMRGALYFWSRPNEDSLAPVTAHIRADIDTIISSLNWEN